MIFERIFDDRMKYAPHVWHSVFDICVLDACGSSFSPFQCVVTCRLNARDFVMEIMKGISSGKITVVTLSQTLQVKRNAVFHIIVGGGLEMFQTIKQ